MGESGSCQVVVLLEGWEGDSPSIQLILYEPQLLHSMSNAAPGHRFLQRHTY